MELHTAPSGSDTETYGTFSSYVPPHTPTGYGTKPNPYCISLHQAVLASSHAAQRLPRDGDATVIMALISTCKLCTRHCCRTTFRLIKRIRMERDMHRRRPRSGVDNAGDGEKTRLFASNYVDVCATKKLYSELDEMNTNWIVARLCKEEKGTYLQMMMMIIIGKCKLVRRSHVRLTDHDCCATDNVSILLQQ